MIAANSQSILEHLYWNSAISDNLLAVLRAKKVAEQIEGAKLILEICTMSQQLPSEMKATFFTRLADSKLVQLLVEIMTVGNFTRHYNGASSLLSETSELLQENCDIAKLDRLQLHAVEMLDCCVQILPSKVMTRHNTRFS
jgi:hypothetical protein